VLRLYRDIPKLGKARALKQLKDTLEREREIEAQAQARVDAALAQRKQKAVAASEAQAVPQSEPSGAAPE
jgi:hypothetical protein